MDTQLEHIKNTLEKIKSLPETIQLETTIFGIGSRGYYENPTTDILAFFIDDNAAHGLGSLVLEALITTLTSDLNSLDNSLSSPPQREVVIEAGRIDMLLENEQWVMVIENKIFHQQNNPFAAYENFIHSKYPDKGAVSKKKKFFVVLSPSGSTPPQHPAWVGVSYPALITAIKQKLAEHFMAQPLNKWIVLLREFILHLENIMTKTSVSNESLHFVLDNLIDLKKAQDLKVKTINSYQNSLQRALQNELGTNIKTALQHWNGFPAIRFSYANWSSTSDVVLFLDGRDDKSFCLNYYASSITNEEERKIADAHLKEDDCREPWNEERDTYRCYKAHFDGLSNGEHKLDTIQKMMTHKLRLMDKFETEVRPTLNK